MRFRNEMYDEFKNTTILNSIAISKANICAEALKEKFQDQSFNEREGSCDNKKYGLDLLLILMGYIGNKYKVYCIGDGIERLDVYSDENAVNRHLAAAHIDKQCYYLYCEYQQRKDILSTIVNYDEYGFDDIAKQINLRLDEYNINIKNKENFKVTSFIYELLALGNIYEIFKVILTTNFLEKNQKNNIPDIKGMIILVDCSSNLFTVNIVNGELIYKDKKYKFEEWSNYDLEESFTFITNCIGENIFLKASIGGATGPSYSIKIYDNNISYNSCGTFGSDIEEELIRVSDDNLIEFKNTLKELKIDSWKKEYRSKDIIMDGTSWSVDIYLEDKFIKSSGSNSYPKSFNKFCRSIKNLTGREFS